MSKIVSWIKPYPELTLESDTVCNCGKPLMARPTQLHIVLNEGHPTKRYSTQSVQPFVIQDMSQMANFVYSYYMEKVKALKEYYQSQIKWSEPGECEIREHEGIISSHPGEDRDTDSEDENDDKGKQLHVPIQEEPIEEQTEKTPESMESETEKEEQQSEKADDAGGNEEEEEENE